MTITLTSPYPDDETRTRDICMVLEDWIQLVWNVTGIPVDKVKFGASGNTILQSGKSITLRAYTFFSKRNRMDISGHRWEFIDSLHIDVYKLNNNNNTARDPDAIKIQKFLESIFIINQSDIPKGIFDINLRGSEMMEDPIKKNITRVFITLDVRYIADVVDI